MGCGTVSLSDLFGTDTTVGPSKCGGERVRERGEGPELSFVCL